MSPAPGMVERPRWLTVRTVGTAALATSLGVLPPFMLGAMSFQIRPELDLSETALGGAIAVFFACSSLSSVHGGRLAQRVGAKYGMLIAAVATAVSLLGVGLMAHTWWHASVFLAVGGLGMALSAAASNLSVARLITPGRQGLAYGVSKAAGPAATMVAGFAVPAIALTVGWRWAFVGAGLSALVVFLIAPDDVAVHSARPQVITRPDASRLPLVILAVAVGFGIGAGNSMGAFFVESAVARGFEPGFAGLALAIGSVTGLLARILWGWVADRLQSGRLHMVSGLMALGGVGMLPLAFVEGRAALVGVAMVVFSAAWGWTGLLILAVVRVSPRAPAAATGVTGAGMFAGATAGPLAFGAAAQQGSYLLMWSIGTVALIVAAILTEVALGRLRAEREGHERASESTLSMG